MVELLRKAIEWQALLDSGKIANQADIARREGVTRARVTQIMGMLRLAHRKFENKSKRYPIQLNDLLLQSECFAPSETSRITVSNFGNFTSSGDFRW